MNFHTFAQALFEIENTASRLEMTALLAKVYAKLDLEEVPQALYFMQGSLVPEYQRLEFQLSVKMVLKSLALIQVRKDAATYSTVHALFETADTANSATEKVLSRRYKELGDIGLLAEQVLQELEQATKKEKKETQTVRVDHSISHIFSLLIEVAQESGQGSQQRKLEKVAAILTKVSPVSAKYIVRMIVGKLRLGFSTMTMLDALSWTIHGDKSDTHLLENAFNNRADIGKLAQHYLQPGLSVQQRRQAIEKIEVTVGIPVMPALCQRLNTATEIIEKMPTVYAEPKYDGLRIQIHFNRNASSKEKQITAHTRNLDDITHMFPELLSASDFFKADQLILDGEAIGYDPETKSLRAFQDTITRRRKHSVSEQAQKIPIRFYLYDILYIDGTSLISKSLQKRKDVLKSVLIENEVFLETPLITTSDPIELRTFHEEQLAAGFEGAVIKHVDSPYVSGRKGWNWVKIKEEEGTTGKLLDTVDCIVMGYYKGRGKRAQFGLGALLVGVRNKKNDTIQTVAKIGTGLSEQQLVDLKEKCDAIAVQTMPSQFDIPKTLIPDVIVTPKLVLEIAADELTNSPLHTAGQALRFPRLIKVRYDKSVDQATTITELSALMI